MNKKEEIFVNLNDIFNDKVEPKRIKITKKIVEDHEDKVNNLVIHEPNIFRNKTIIERKVFDSDWLDDE